MLDLLFPAGRYNLANKFFVIPTFWACIILISQLKDGSSIEIWRSVSMYLYVFSNNLTGKMKGMKAEFA
uniref:Uncharacterized protein n=1 Tax=Lotus japonicus TaxID=34305 RepID=I3S6F4_LOTJA|nr:unknown [Lotus japonicus]